MRTFRKLKRKTPAGLRAEAAEPSAVAASQTAPADSGSAIAVPESAPLSAVAKEAALMVLGLVAAAALVSRADPVLLLRFQPHPIWLAVLILAARYGNRGLAIVLPIAWGAVAVTAVCLGAPLSALAGRLGSGPELGALVGAVLVAWVSSMHERRTLELREEKAFLEARCTKARTVANELRRAVVAVRARADRVDTSLAFLRSVAGRLDGHDPEAAAHAALELARSRIGALAGVVQIAEHGRLRTLAWSGVWSSDNPMPPDFLNDSTVNAACEQGGPLRALDMTAALREGGSDMAAPILDGSGRPIGVIALRGVPPESLGAASLNDLGVIARWCARSFVEVSEDDVRTRAGGE